MNEFELDVVERLGRIETKLDNDFHILHGNGEPGLLERVNELEHEVLLLTSKKHWIKEWLGWLFAIGNLVALYLKN